MLLLRWRRHLLRHLLQLLLRIWVEVDVGVRRQLGLGLRETVRRGMSGQGVGMRCAHACGHRRRRRRQHRGLALRRLVLVLRWLLIQLVLRWRLWRLLRRLLRNLLRELLRKVRMRGGSGLRHIRRALVILGVGVGEPVGRNLRDGIRTRGMDE